MLHHVLQKGSVLFNICVDMFTCLSPFPFSTVRQMLTFWSERCSKVAVWAAFGSTVWGCCKRDLSRPVSCCCWVPRRCTPPPGWRRAAPVGSVAPSVGWSDLRRAGSCGAPRPSDGPRWERRSCGSRSPTGQSRPLSASRSAGRSWRPGSSSCSASSEAAMTE